MKFRPLCIDYHSRAQEIVATERDAAARRTALRALPNPSPLRNSRRRISCPKDSIGSDLDRCSEETSSRHDRKGGNNRSCIFEDNDCDDDEDSETTDEKKGRQPNEHGDSKETSMETASGNEGSANDCSRRRIQSIMKLLGPAIHPSECAFRSIAPLTKGPVRGRKLPILETSSAKQPLGEITTYQYPDHEEKKRDAVIGCMESGRSRFNRLSDDDACFALSSKDSMQTQFGGTMEDTTFLDTMKIVCSRSSSSEDSIRIGNREPEKENSDLKSRAWAQHVNNLPWTEAIYLKHEPDDLAKIYRLKSWRSSAATRTAFANEILSSFRPPLRALKSEESHRWKIGTRKGLALFGLTSGDLGKPKIDLIDNSKSWEEEDYTLRLNSLTFTHFLDDIGSDEYGACVQDINPSDTVMRVTASSDTRKEDMAQGLTPLACINDVALMIRGDPNFDPSHLVSSKKKRKHANELLKPLNKMCSPSVISHRLCLPGRFEESHKLSGELSRFLLPQKKQTLEFLENCWEGFKELLTTTLDSRDEVSGIQILPRKISLDADVEPPSLVREENLRPKSDTRQSLGSSILTLPSFTGMIPFSSVKKTVDEQGSQRRNKRLYDRFIGSFSRVSKVDALKNVVNSNKANCLFLSQSNALPDTDGVFAERKISLSTQQQSASNALVSTVRSCVPSTNMTDSIALLQRKFASYPIAPWFESTVNKASNNPSELDSTILSLTRKKFCHNAKTRSNDEESRCVLLTGCSSRRNAESRYSYRGFLTNRVVDPVVFKLRYTAMIEMNKFCKRQNDPKTSAHFHSAALALAQPRFHELFFARMALRVFGDASIRSKSIASKKSSKRWGAARSAPYALRLKTKMHGHSKIAASKANGVTVASSIASRYFIRISKIEELATSVKSVSAGGHYGAEAGVIVVNLGKISLKVRGELLHLVIKAREFEEEKQSYLTELAVVNRGRVNTPKHVPSPTPYTSDKGSNSCVKVDKYDKISATDEVHAIDLAVLDDRKLSGKRKVESESKAFELAVDQCKEKKRKKKRGNIMKDSRQRKGTKKKRKKKKEKKKKRTKKEREKHHKRKLEDATQREDPIMLSQAPFNSSKKRKIVDLSKEHNQPPSSVRINAERSEYSACAKTQTMRVIVPAIPIGMTPINPPTKSNLLKKYQVGQNHDSAQERNDPLVGGTKQSLNKMTETSSDDEFKDSVKNRSTASVANLGIGAKTPHRDSKRKKEHSYQQTPHGNSDYFRECEENDNVKSSQGNDAKVIGDNDVNKCQVDGSGGGPSPPPRPEEPQREEHPTHHENESIPRSILDTPERRCSPRTLLTSENFLETFGETIAELASGRWLKTTTSSELRELSEPENIGDNGDVPKGIVICDCPLLDIAGADIELSDDSAIIVQCLSSWLEINQSGKHGANASSVQQGARTFIRRLVWLAASGRYHAIHVILCLDVEISSALTGEIVTLQNAVIQQNDCPCEHVTFEYAVPRTLAASIALQVASVSNPQNSSKIAEFVSDENVQERARFLVMLVPSMTVHMALRCLGFSTESNCIESGEALQNLLSIAKSTPQELFPDKIEDIKLSSSCAQQLWLAFNVDISHAY